MRKLGCQRLGHRDAILQVDIHPLPRKGIAQTVTLYSEPVHRIAIPRLSLLERLALRQPTLSTEHVDRLAHRRQRVGRVRQMRGPHLAALGAEHHLDAAVPIRQSPFPLHQTVAPTDSLHRPQAQVPFQPDQRPQPFIGNGLA